MAEHVFIATSALVGAPTAVTDPVALPYSLGDNVGVLIATRDLPAFLDRYQLQARGKPTPSDYEGIDCLKLSTQAPTVTVLHWNGENLNEFVKRTQTFAALIKRDVTIEVPHQCWRVPTGTADTLAILIWSAPPDIPRNIRPPQKFRGIPISCLDLAFRPTSDSLLTVADPETGYVVAEVVNDTLYILHDICHHGSDDELRLFELVLEEAATLLTVPPEELKVRRAEIKRLAAEQKAKAEAEAKEREAEAKRQRAAKTKQAYVALCQARVITDSGNARAQLDRANIDIARLQQELTAAVRQAAAAENYLHGLTSSAGKAERYGTEFDRLTSLDRVQEVTINGQVIEVLTETIYCPHPKTGQVHELGRFKISISTEGDSYGNYLLRFINLDRQPKHPNGDVVMNAPHVNSVGNPCLGNIKEMIPQLIGRHEYPALIMMAIAFLESANVDDQWGQSLSSFPLKTTTEEE